MDILKANTQLINAENYKKLTFSNTLFHVPIVSYSDHI